MNTKIKAATEKAIKTDLVQNHPVGYTTNTATKEEEQEKFRDLLLRTGVIKEGDQEDIRHLQSVPLQSLGRVALTMTETIIRRVPLF